MAARTAPDVTYVFNPAPQRGSNQRSQYTQPAALLKESELMGNSPHFLMQTLFYS